MAISEIHIQFPHSNFRDLKQSPKSSPCDIVNLRSPAVCSPRASRVSSYPGIWFPPDSLYFFSPISFSNFPFSVYLTWECQVQSLLEDIGNGAAPSPFACFAIGDWSSSQHSVSYCTGTESGSGWFPRKLKRTS